MSAEDEDNYGEEGEEIRDTYFQESDPQVLKVTDKIKLFRHKCVASLGNSLYEQALEMLRLQVTNNTPKIERRKALIQILGDENIGFWAILDQIIFYEDLVVEIKSISTTAASQIQSTHTDSALTN